MASTTQNRTTLDPSPLSYLGRANAWPGMWTVGQLMANADRLLTESARSNAAAALHEQNARRASWLAEASDWQQAEDVIDVRGRRA